MKLHRAASMAIDLVLLEVMEYNSSQSTLYYVSIRSKPFVLCSVAYLILNMKKKGTRWLSGFFLFDFTVDSIAFPRKDTSLGASDLQIRHALHLKNN